MILFNINSFIRITSSIIDYVDKMTLKDLRSVYTSYVEQFTRKHYMSDQLTTKVTDELVGASIPSLVLGLGMAIAEANAALQKSGSKVVYTIPEADIEMAVAISITSKKEASVNAGGSIYAFNVNASYSNVFGYTAEASSKIRIKLKAMLPEVPPVVTE